MENEQLCLSSVQPTQGCSPSIGPIVFAVARDEDLDDVCETPGDAARAEATQHGLQDTERCSFHLGGVRGKDGFQRRAGLHPCGPRWEDGGPS